MREASYLARLTPKRLECKAHEARKARVEIIKAHMLTEGSQSSLRLRVKAILGELPDGIPNSGEIGWVKSNALLKKNPYDPRHLFYEEAQRLTDAISQIEADDLKAKALSELLRQFDKLFNMLRRIKPRGRSIPGKNTLS
jgi:hypothetical protein